MNRLSSKRRVAFLSIRQSPLAREGLLAALITWFAIVLLTFLPVMRPRPFTLPESHGRYEPYLDDFVVFYSAASLLRKGEGSQVYNWTALRKAEAHLAGAKPAEVEPLPFFNPPHALLLLLPLTLLPPGAAAVVWLTGTIMLAMAGLWLLLETRGPPRSLGLRCCAALAVLSSLPSLQAMLHGQLSFLLLFAVCLLYLGLARDRTVLVVAGLLLLGFKPQLVILPLLALLLLGRFQIVAWFAVCLLALTLATDALAGRLLEPAYITLLRESLQWDGVNGVARLSMFGWVGLLRGLIGPAQQKAQQTALTVLNGLTLATASLGLLLGTRRRRRPSLLLSLALVAGLIASPHFYAQDLLLLVPVLVTLPRSEELRPRATAWLLGLILWFVMYVHFDILSRTHINLTTLFLLGLLAWLFWQLGRPPADVSGADAADASRQPAATPHAPVTVAVGRPRPAGLRPGKLQR